MEGSVSRRIQPVKEQLLELIALLEAGIDFADNDVDVAPAEEILRRATAIAASTGAACHAGRTEPSSVLLSMGIPRDQALGAIRLSLGRWTTEEQVDIAAAALEQSVSALSRHSV